MKTQIRQLKPTTSGSIKTPVTQKLLGTFKLNFAHVSKHSITFSYNLEMVSHPESFGWLLFSRFNTPL